MLRLFCGLSMEQGAVLGHLQRGDVFLAYFLQKRQPCSACIPFLSTHATELGDEEQLNWTEPER